MSIALCLAVAGHWVAAIALPQNVFELRWSHSVEKIAWTEEYRAGVDGLRLHEARVRGTGAGMEIPPGAQLHDGAWHYQPNLPTLRSLRISRSGYAGDYTLCVSLSCVALDAVLGPLPSIEGYEVELTACRVSGKPLTSFQHR